MPIQDAINKISRPAEKTYPDLGGYWLGGKFSASPEIRKITDEYKIKSLKSMKSLYPPDLEPKKLKVNCIIGELIVTEKIDGMYNTLYYDERSAPNSVFCNSPNGRARYHLPVHQEI